uniref:DOMON domain-containing protein n=1 Tax=Brugia malayi TaxID=6279 RepID=A0A7I4NLL2_BRUMA
MLNFKQQKRFEVVQQVLSAYHGRDGFFVHFNAKKRVSVAVFLRCLEEQLMANWLVFLQILSVICLSYLISGCVAACKYQQGQYQLQFARDQQHNDGLDFISVRVLDNKVLVSDEFVQGFRQPKLDDRQNVIVQYASLHNGNLRVRLARPIISNDTADFSLANCLPWQFPIALSPLDPTGQIRKHQITPHEMVVCINRCPCGSTSTPNECQL